MAPTSGNWPDLVCLWLGTLLTSPSSLLQVERLQALNTIRMKESLICLECTVESSQNSCMLTLPLSLFDMDSKPLRTLVRDFSRRIFYSHRTQYYQCPLASLVHPWLLKIIFISFGWLWLSSPLIWQKPKFLPPFPFMCLLLFFSSISRYFLRSWPVYHFGPDTQRTWRKPEEKLKSPSVG